MPDVKKSKLTYNLVPESYLSRKITAMNTNGAVLKTEIVTFQPTGGLSAILII